MTHLATVFSLTLTLLGPAEDSPSIPRSQQAVPPVGLVPHAPEPVEQPAEAAVEEAHESKPPAPEVSVVFMPKKKKPIGVKAPSAPLRCEDPIGCRRMLIAGAIGGGLSVATIIVGAVLATRPDVILAAEPAYMRSTRNVGFLVTAAGAMGAISSGFLLIASLRRSAEASKAAARVPRERIRF